MKETKVPRPAIAVCRACRGVGRVVHKGKMVTCPNCRGNGKAGYVCK